MLFESSVFFPIRGNCIFLRKVQEFHWYAIRRLVTCHHLVLPGSTVSPCNQSQTLRQRMRCL